MINLFNLITEHLLYSKSNAIRLNVHLNKQINNKKTHKDIHARTHTHTHARTHTHTHTHIHMHTQINKNNPQKGIIYALCYLPLDISSAAFFVSVTFPGCNNIIVCNIINILVRWLRNNYDHREMNYIQTVCAHVRMNNYWVDSNSRFACNTPLFCSSVANSVIICSSAVYLNLCYAMQMNEMLSRKFIHLLPRYMRKEHFFIVCLYYKMGECLHEKRIYTTCSLCQIRITC